MGDEEIMNAEQPSAQEQPLEEKKEEKKNHSHLVIVVAIIGLFILGGYNTVMAGNYYKPVNEIENIKTNLDTLKYNQDLIIATQEKFTRDFSPIQNIDMSVSELWMDKMNAAAKEKLDGWQNDNAEFLNCNKNFNKLMIRSNYLNVNHDPGYFLISTYDKGEFVISEKGDAWCWKYPIMTLEQVPVNCSELCISKTETKLNEIDKQDAAQIRDGAPI